MSKNWFFPDNVDTDLIIPGQYLSLTDPSELAKYCMMGFNPSIASQVQPGDIFVAGKNFGCGSSREHAPESIKALGIKCIIAESFARIFFRNSINIGLPVFQCAEAVVDIAESDQIELDLVAGKIHNISNGKSYFFTAFPPMLMQIIESGGVINTLKSKR